MGDETRFVNAIWLILNPPSLMERCAEKHTLKNSEYVYSIKKKFRDVALANVLLICCAVTNII